MYFGFRIAVVYTDTTFSKMRRFDRVYVSEKDYDTQAFKVIIEPTLGTRNIFIEYDTNMDRTE